jgi:purine-nucleoside phosphorylase
MLQLASQIEVAASVVRERWSTAPRAAIILGSGLGALADEISVEATIEYGEIPHFPQVSALGHRGLLVCGTLAGVPVLAFQGRFHLFEGHDAQWATLPVRVARALGAQTLIATNAAGGMNPRYQMGDMMLIEDHINMMFDNPLIGINDDGLGPRFPDMSAPYDRELMLTAAKIARRDDFVLHQGTYVAMLGPTYETRAEYRMLKLLGGDVVGMSTVPEVLVARHEGLRVLGISTIANACSPDELTKTSGEAVIAAAGTAVKKLTTLVRGVVETL